MKLNLKQIAMTGAAAMAMIFVVRKFFPEQAKKVLDPTPSPLLK